MGPRYRRRRTKDQAYRLLRTIMRNYARFFPRGVPTIFFNEWEALRAKGRVPPERFVPKHSGLLGPGEVPKPPRLAKFCPACGRRFWYRPSRGDYKFCGSRCRDAARMSAVFTVFPDYDNGQKPETTELRLWCYTHLAGPPSASAAQLVIRNLEDTLNRSLNDYFDEKLPLTPAQQSALRSRVEVLVARQLTRASAILAGTARSTWNAQQTALFKALLNKVLPDMTASMSLNLSQTLNSQNSINPADLSREQLEELLTSLLPAPGYEAPTPVIDAETLDPIPSYSTGLVSKNRKGKAQANRGRPLTPEARAAATAGIHRARAAKKENSE